MTTKDNGSTIDVGPGSPAQTNTGAKGTRKPYRRPQVLSREPLEAMAESCPPPHTGNGKGSSLEPGCQKISS